MPYSGFGARRIVAQSLLEMRLRPDRDIRAEKTERRKKDSCGRIRVRTFALGKGRARASRCGVGLRNALEVLFDVFGDDRALIHLDDVAVAVDQERCWQAEIAVTIEQLAIENVVDGGDVVGSAQNRKSRVRSRKRELRHRQDHPRSRRSVADLSLPSRRDDFWSARNSSRRIR